MNDSILYTKHIENTQKQTAPPRKQTKRSTHTHTHTATTQDTNANTGRRMKRRKLYHINNNNIRHSAATHTC